MNIGRNEAVGQEEATRRGPILARNSWRDRGEGKAVLVNPSWLEGTALTGGPLTADVLW